MKATAALLALFFGLALATPKAQKLFDDLFHDETKRRWAYMIATPDSSKFQSPRDETKINPMTLGSGK
ncbi:uncharacterized protein DNG_08150 [Cephalotrichum gorgonifer]|uniref:Uncharacterized protein n=1 Tax=Cephalotrichum gorgonifer TaxID=2041049 RepID=A0AAE8N550_9PEZI|nr:uncharacterized protein DNG_08150 [Cephalotrichum gorgonifer]